MRPYSWLRPQRVSKCVMYRALRRKRREQDRSGWIAILAISAFIIAAELLLYLIATSPHQP